MKHYCWMAFLIAFATISQARDLYSLSNLEGLEVTHTEFGKRLSEGRGFTTIQDKIAGQITISVEKESGEDQHYIDHNGGKQRVFPVRGMSSITFVEVQGGNVYLWTICLEEKNNDGTVLAIMAANLTDGAIGIRNKVFRGKATLLK